MTKPCLLLIILLGSMTILMIGCGKKFPLVPVSGTVTIKGKPLADHQIGFVAADPMAAGLGATGITDAQGRYTMTSTTGKAGCPAGLCQVYIQWNLPESVKEDMAKSTKPIPIHVPVELPPNASNGSLTFDVPATGTQSANIDL